MEADDQTPEQLAQLEKQNRKQEYMFRCLRKTTERIVRYLENLHPPEEYFRFRVPKGLSLMGLMVSAILFVFYILFGVVIGLAWAETNRQPRNDSWLTFAWSQVYKVFFYH